MAHNDPWELLNANFAFKSSGGSFLKIGNMANNNSYFRALTIAGFDGSGGAGLQADLKTFSALGCYGMTVVTAVTAQNTTGVKSIYSIPEKCIEEQLLAIIDDIGIDALKIGMLHRSEIVHVIAKVLAKQSSAKIVLDPVMLAKSGDLLLSPDGVELMKSALFPITTLLTPNLPEASVLLKRAITSIEQMEEAAVELMGMGPKAVVIKGGHLANGSCSDCLCIRDSTPKIFWFSSPRFESKNVHGTGCTFSAAVTAYLCQGLEIRKAVERAKDYITGCIKAGASYQIGTGHGPVHHFYAQWK